MRHRYPTRLERSFSLSDMFITLIVVIIADPLEVKVRSESWRHREMQPLDEETHPANMSVQRNTSIQERGTRSASPSSAGSWRPSVFDFRSGGTCPTCHGTGRIPKGTRGGQGGESLELLRVVSRSQTLGKQERVWS